MAASAFSERPGVLRRGPPTTCHRERWRSHRTSSLISPTRSAYWVGRLGLTSETSRANRPTRGSGQVERLPSVRDEEPSSAKSRKRSVANSSPTAVAGSLRIRGHHLSAVRLARFAFPSAHAKCSPRHAQRGIFTIIRGGGIGAKIICRRIMLRQTAEHVGFT